MENILLDYKNQKNIQLFAISFVMLFLEIFLIRWISTEVRIFAYASNLVLLACFLGIGLGCYFSKKDANILITIGALVFISLAVNSRLFQGITNMLGGFSDSIIWYQAIEGKNFIPALSGTMLTIIMFLMISAVFVAPGQILGRLLDEHSDIVAGYSINAAASLIGIWVFNAFSFLYTPPWSWFAFSLLILLLFVRRTKFNMFLAISASLLILLVTGALNFSLPVMWSPYQKLSIYANNVNPGIMNGNIINVNNVGYMSILDLSDEFIKRYPDLYDAGMRKYCMYELPYRFAASKDAVFIVGSGAGNDVAGAIRSGAKEIDAVEIDPGIYKLGVSLHPEHPYEKENVNIVIDDARAFFKKTKKKYDIISFGLLDSHILSSNYNNVRLDHYVYTEESFKDVKKILKYDGIVSVIFASPTIWIGERIYGLLKKVFGDAPYVISVDNFGDRYGWGGVMFISGNNLATLKQAVETNHALKDFIAKNSVTYENRAMLTTDDWPYLYIQGPSIPRMYILIIVSILVILFIIKRFLTSAENNRINMHFFFLGSAFLLLEFQNVSKAALLFGSTWIVNSYIISSILLLGLLANLFIYHFKAVSTRLFYILLLASLTVLYVIPIEIFNIYGYWTKSILAVMLLNLPVFFAGVIFINSFKNSPSKHTAFGSNMMGAAVGGLLETISFISGIRALLLAVAALYILSFLYLKENRQ